MPYRSYLLFRRAGAANSAPAIGVADKTASWISFCNSKLACGCGRPHSLLFLQSRDRRARPSCIGCGGPMLEVMCTSKQRRHLADDFVKSIRKKAYKKETRPPRPTDDKTPGRAEILRGPRALHSRAHAKNSPFARGLCMQHESGSNRRAVAITARLAQSAVRNCLEP